MLVANRILTNCNLFMLLERAAATWPDDVAQIRGDHRLTFLELKIAAERLASEFRRADIKPRDKIGFLCPNGPAYVIGSFALFLIDAVVVPIFPGLKAMEIAALDAELCLDGFCYSPELESALPKEIKSNPRALDLGEHATSFYLQPTGRTNPTALSADILTGEGAPLIRFTSGTTSRAKGVIIPQSAMLEYTHRFADVYGIQRGDRILNLLSMAHIFYQITAGMLRGATLIVEDAGNASAVGGIIYKENVTHIEAAPSFYSMGLAADEWAPDQFRDVRYITSCGASLANSVADVFRKRFGREIVQRYGLTETGPVLINTSEDERKRGSLGVPAPHCELRLAAVGQQASSDIGEVQIRCPGLFAGYYSPPTSRSDILQNGWFCTGDIAYKDDDGYYWITGRVKTVINVGAVKVFPSELEDILLSDSDVREAYVYAAEDARLGEVPHAKVVLRTGSPRTQKELLQHVNRSVSVFKAVRRIEIVSDLAKTQNGKIKRYESTET
jgi:long-chain acyl-CoA synthetase